MSSSSLKEGYTSTQTSNGRTYYYKTVNGKKKRVPEAEAVSNVKVGNKKEKAKKDTESKQKKKKGEKDTVKKISKAKSSKEKKTEKEVKPKEKEVKPKKEKKEKVVKPKKAPKAKSARKPAQPKSPKAKRTPKAKSPKLIKTNRGVFYYTTVRDEYDRTYKNFPLIYSDIQTIASELDKLKSPTYSVTINYLTPNQMAAVIHFVCLYATVPKDKHKSLYVDLFRSHIPPALYMFFGSEEVYNFISSIRNRIQITSYVHEAEVKVNPDQIISIPEAYQILELPVNSPKDVVKKQWRMFQIKYHPDKHPGKEKEMEQKISVINRAYDILKPYLGIV